jgi:hypothetical protein
VVGNSETDPTTGIFYISLVSLTRFKEILSAIEDAQLEGKIKSREEAMELVKKEYKLASGSISG